VFCDYANVCLLMDVVYSLVEIDDDLLSVGAAEHPVPKAVEGGNRSEGQWAQASVVGH
jgi:hypothetical protein